MISGALAILKSDAQRNEMSAIYKKNKNRLLSIALKILQSEEEAEQLNVSKKVVNQRLCLARKAIKKFIDERRNRNE